MIATRKLVDSDEEQGLLEELLEGVKPPVPRETEGLHYLLSTPFRHPPLRHGSRFATRHEPSLWYGSEALATAFAEVAYYRLLFLEGTSAELEPIEVELSAFQARIRSERCVDLGAGPFREYQLALRSATSYAATQALGAAMRADGVEMFLFGSARSDDGGRNVALFTSRVFTRKKPTVPQTWRCIATRAGVEIVRRDYFTQARHRFEREQFLVQAVLPRPAI
ncbi:RES family NAD+ phosphorylase [Vulgatibacter sp.]|uniref:RES family NAD+ phosphorylase n=1 Tax=Vulgatibacter sp. TaxID=1971226 RepID=UPI003563D0AB